MRALCHFLNFENRSIQSKVMQILDSPWAVNIETKTLAHCGFMITHAIQMYQSLENNQSM